MLPNNTILNRKIFESLRERTPCGKVVKFENFSTESFQNSKFGNIGNKFRKMRQLIAILKNSFGNNLVTFFPIW